MKRKSGIFDVTMGAYDGAEVCELVGMYLLSILSAKCEKENIGLYRDDGLAVFKDLSGPEAERIKSIFKILLYPYHGKLLFLFFQDPLLFWVRLVISLMNTKSDKKMIEKKVLVHQ